MSTETLITLFNKPHSLNRKRRKNDAQRRIAPASETAAERNTEVETALSRRRKGRAFTIASTTETHQIIEQETMIPTGVAEKAVSVSVVPAGGSPVREDAIRGTTRELSAYSSEHLTNPANRKRW